MVSLLLKLVLLGELHLSGVIEALIGWLASVVSGSHMVVIELRLISDVPVHFLLDQELVLLTSRKVLLDITRELVLRPLLLWLASHGFVDPGPQGQLRVNLIVEL